MEKRKGEKQFEELLEELESKEITSEEEDLTFLKPAAQYHYCSQPCNDI